MQVLEYRVELPLIAMDKYNTLLLQTINTENPNIVSILESGFSDYAILPSRKNRNSTNILRTIKLYDLPIIYPEKIKTTTFLKFPYSRTKIGSNISIISTCSTRNNENNIFLIPNPLLSSRTVIPLDLTQAAIWNFSNAIVENILGVPTPAPVPETPVQMFIYILVLISEENTIPINLDLFKAYIILLHRKILASV